MNDRNQASALLALALMATFACAAPPSIPWKEDEPFPYGLLSELERGGWGREELTRRLGSPDATRKSGRLALWIEARQLELDPVGGVFLAEIHHLVVEYDEQWQVVRHQLVVNSGCLPSGECLTNIWCRPTLADCRPSRPGSPSAGIAEWKGQALERVVLYAAAEDDLRAKSFEPPADRCRIFVFRRNTDNTRYGGPNVTLGRDPTPQEVAIPLFGFLTWDGAPGSEEMRIAWSDWKAEYQRETIEIPCEGGRPTFLEIVLHPVKFWGWQFDIEPRSLSRSAGEVAVEDRSRVLE